MIDLLDLRSINEPHMSRETMLTPNSINEPLHLPGGIPTIEGTAPYGAPEGTGDILIVVHGTNLTENCVVNFNGEDYPTTFERPDKINATVSLDGLTAGEYPLAVKLFGASTPPVTFTVTAIDSGVELADPDDLEDEIEQAEDDGEFKPTHRSAKRGKTKR